LAAPITAWLAGTFMVCWWAAPFTAQFIGLQPGWGWMPPVGNFVAWGIMIAATIAAIGMGFGRLAPVRAERDPLISATLGGMMGMLLVQELGFLSVASMAPIYFAAWATWITVNSAMVGMMLSSFTETKRGAFVAGFTWHAAMGGVIYLLRFYLGIFG